MRKAPRRTRNPEKAMRMHRQFPPARGQLRLLYALFKRRVDAVIGNVADTVEDEAAGEVMT